MVALVRGAGLVLGKRVREGVAPLVGVSPTARCRLAGFFRTGKSDRTWDSGTVRTPSAGAEFMTTPAAPSPRSRSAWVKTPPVECPIRISARSSPMISFSRLERISGTVAASIASGRR